jgi:hypothetical protein
MPVGAMTTRPAPKPGPWDFETLLIIDKRIDTREDENVRDRWEFGRVMLDARSGKKRLPNGYLAALIERTGKSRAELGFRIRFAEAYPTEAELSNALDSFTSWHDVVESLYASEELEQDVPVDLPDDATSPDGKERPAQESQPDVPQPQPQPDAPPQPEPKADSEPEPKADSEPEPKPKPQADTADTAKRKPKGQAPAEANDEVPPIDWASIPVTYKKKINAEVKRRCTKFYKEIEAGFESRVQAEVTRREDWADARISEMYKKITDFESAQRSAQRRGVITEEDWKLIRECLHSDRQPEELKPKYDRAFQIWNDAKTKIKFIPPHFDSAQDELAKLRAEKRYKDHIKRQERKKQREQQQQQEDASPSAPQSG